jgi:hypothetical protein
MKNRFEFYVGIIPEDEEKFFDYIDILNYDSSTRYPVVEVLSCFDDPNGYFTLVVKGDLVAYSKFYKNTEEDINWVKSLYHYEED